MDFFGSLQFVGAKRALERDGDFAEELRHQSVPDSTKKKQKKTKVVEQKQPSPMQDVVADIKLNLTANQRTVSVPNIPKRDSVDITKIDDINRIVGVILNDKADDPIISEHVRKTIMEDIQNNVPLDDYAISGYNRSTTDVAAAGVIQSLMDRYSEKTSKSAKEMAAESITRISLPQCTRRYEEQQLREPTGTERPCVAGEKCFCNRHFGFVMKEFIMPDEQQEIKKGNAFKSKPGFCLCCLREWALQAYIKAATRNMNVKHHFVQSHQIFVNIPGEYSSKDCFMGCTSIYPQIMHSISTYQKRIKNGMKYLTQDQLSLPNEQDFRSGDSQKA